VAMHHTHRNLAGLVVSAAPNESVFAGDVAHMRISLGNTAAVARYELIAAGDEDASKPVAIESLGRQVVAFNTRSQRRGRLVIDHILVSSVYPLGLFKAWTHIYLPMTCIVYPRPIAHTEPPRSVDTDTGGAQDARQGDDDFAGLGTFHPGDSPARIAWKAYARGHDLQVKQYSATVVTSHRFDFNGLEGLDTETRLAILCRWIEDAHAARQAFGLSLPGIDIEPNIGLQHRHLSNRPRLVWNGR
jgi:hypothetical protein